MNSVISFAKQVKEESTRAERTIAEKKAVLSAYIRINGYLVLRSGKDGLEMASENAMIAKIIYQYLRDLYDVSPRFAYTRSSGFLKRVMFHVIVDENVDFILNDLEIDILNPRNPKEIIASPEGEIAYLSGAFLAAGSVNDPVSSNYHLEIALSDQNYAKFISRLWNHTVNGQFESKIIKRRSQYVVYIKKGDQVSNFLILIGANDCCLKFENVRIDRDFANIENRRQNLYNANYRKSASTGDRQIEEINSYLQDKGGWGKIDNMKLAILMRMRIDNPDASLAELSVLVSEEMNTEVTKSNINHLFRFLHNYYLAEKK
ncbi:MAG: DNA-binding protein WhiA [Bacilli bacterium]|nr:DNA-binding protein WhiA [Bacilli bacterium]